MTFPAEFVWGAASSAYQIEGAKTAAGKGLSNWDVFCSKPGAIWGGHVGDEACDHVARFEEDVAILKQLGVRAYRFSVAWPRVIPDGNGAVNTTGLGFYDRLVDALLAAGIEPWVTLFHWDFPQPLELRGGWLNAESPRWFGDYAAAVGKRLGDRVTHWMTINEPQIYIGHGHLLGTHAPGLKLPTDQWLLAGHRTLLAHGRGVQALRSSVKKPGLIGWAPCGRVDYPATESAADIEAARNRFAEVHAKDAWNNTWWADPVCLGHYPESGLKLFGGEAPRPEPGDMETIRQPLDFYGVNIYTGTAYRAGPDGRAVEVPHGPGHALTAFRWPIVPESLYWGPRFLSERYGLPVYITENGLANTDFVHADGKVHDPQRIDFTRGYLRQLQRAAREGHARGYFHWSILDNFEWAEGYSMRFGLVHVDFATQRRTPKDSYWWYKDVIAKNRVD